MNWEQTKTDTRVLLMKWMLLSQNWPDIKQHKSPRVFIQFKNQKNEFNQLILNVFLMAKCIFNFIYLLISILFIVSTKFIIKAKR